MRENGKEKQSTFEKIVFYLAWISLAFALAILTVVSFKFIGDGKIPLLRELQDLVLNQNNSDEEIQTFSPEAAIAFMGLWISLSGIFLSSALIFITYYFSKKVVKVTENANEFLYREEEERFILKYQDSMHAFEKINEALKYADLLMEMDYRYLKNQTFFENMEKKVFKEIANYYDVDKEQYWKSTHSHFYFSHEDFGNPVYLHSAEFLEKNDFDYRLKYYQIILKEVFEECIYKKTIEVINTILSDDKKLFGKLIIDLDKFRSELRNIYNLYDNFELEKYLGIRDKYKSLISKKENSTLNDSDIKVYELYIRANSGTQYPKAAEVSIEHLLEVENEIINHFQTLLLKLSSVIQTAKKMDHYFKEVQERSLRISKFL